jgi:pimeloyl-ACP methyl ester carboxylesterase
MPAAAPPTRGHLLVPQGQDAAQPLPVVVFLPYTTGTADLLLEGYLRELRAERRAPAPGFDALVERLGPEGPDGPGPFALLLVTGEGSASDYASGDAWARTIQRYEQRVFDDLAAFAMQVSIDTTRVALAGHSLGGDLAWAIALRNPARVRGAVVMGSRASYRTGAAQVGVLADRGVRFAFAMGTNEDAARLAGARSAARLLEQHSVGFRWDDIPGGVHSPAPLTVLAAGLAYVLGPR